MEQLKSLGGVVGIVGDRAIPERLIATFFRWFWSDSARDVIIGDPESCACMLQIINENLTPLEQIVIFGVESMTELE